MNKTNTEKPETSDKAIARFAPNGIPIFKVKAKGDFRYAVAGKDGKRLRGCHLVFKCPKCKNKNYHGGTYGKKGDGDGHRYSHCQCWPRGYYLREV